MFNPLQQVNTAERLDSVLNVAMFKKCSSPKYFRNASVICGLRRLSESQSILYTLGFPIFIRGIDHILILVLTIGFSALRMVVISTLLSYEMVVTPSIWLGTGLPLRLSPLAPFGTPVD